MAIQLATATAVLEAQSGTRAGEHSGLWPEARVLDQIQANASSASSCALTSLGMCAILLCRASDVRCQDCLTIIYCQTRCCNVGAPRYLEMSAIRNK